jgi:limonene-1,2-epoxide hydrolase
MMIPSPTPMATSAESMVVRDAEPAEVVRSFLLAIEAGELDLALALLADDVEYINVTLPTVRGRDNLDRLFRPALERWHGGFRVHIHAIATSGGIVLTERTDEIIMGPLKARISAYGHTEVVDGQITVWRDAFDWADVLVGVARGLAGAVAPGLNRPWPRQR